MVYWERFRQLLGILKLKSTNWIWFSHGYIVVVKDIPIVLNGLLNQLPALPNAGHWTGLGSGHIDRGWNLSVWSVYDQKRF